MSQENILEITPEKLIDVAEDLVGGKIWVENPYVAAMAADYLISVKILKILQGADEYVDLVYPLEYAAPTGYPMRDSDW